MRGQDRKRRDGSGKFAKKILGILKDHAKDVRNLVYPDE